MAVKVLFDMLLKLPPTPKGESKTLYVITPTPKGGLKTLCIIK